MHPSVIFLSFSEVLLEGKNQFLGSYYNHLPSLALGCLGAWFHLILKQAYKGGNFISIFLE
jgi:hypothetical protein